MREFLLINWNDGDSHFDPDFLFGPTLENVMNGAISRWPIKCKGGFSAIYEAVKQGQLSLYVVERKTLEIIEVDREP